MLLFTCYFMFDSLPPHRLQQPRLLCPSLSPGLCSNSCSWFEMVDDAIQASHPLLPPCPSVLNLSQDKGLLVTPLLVSGGQKFWSFSFSIGPSNIYSLEYSHSTLTSIHDYWKNHSFDYMEFCWPSYVFAF